MTTSRFAAASPALLEYRRRVVSSVACPFCLASPGERCTYYVDARAHPDDQPGDLVALDYVHDDRSHAYQEYEAVRRG